MGLPVFPRPPPLHRLRTTVLIHLQIHHEEPTMVPGNRLLVAGATALAVWTAAAQTVHAAPHYPWQKSYKAVVDQTAAVVQGTVTSVAESYNEREGPRTLVTLSQLKVLWGSLRAPSVVLKLFGGPVPGHRGRVDEVHIPTFVRGKTYVVFLSNRDWRLSPVTARQSFIIERVQGKDLVVTSNGYAVFGIDDVGGPTRTFPVYRIPNEIDENFVPPVDESITPKMVAKAYSVAEFITNLKSWASRSRVSVNGTFNDRPYRTGSWRILTAIPDRASRKSLAGRQLEFAPKSGRPGTPGREEKACWEHSKPTDADPRDRSLICPDGGVR
jgi:hypothetical protein